MAFFKAEFTQYPTDPKLLAAPVSLEFKNISSLGSAIESEYTFAVDATDSKITPLNDLSSYPITEIETVLWDLGDKTVSTSYNVVKKYDFPGLYNIKLSIYSQKLTDINGTEFRIKSVKTITIKVESRMMAWLRMHMTQPHLEALDNSTAFNDLLSSSSKMYDRMYKDITDAANLMDIKKVAPKFLEFFSDTLNHKRFYAKKVGYAKQLDDENKQLFLDYDIFDRISKGIATDPELELFREFIIDTAALFKQKGSTVGIEEFFKLYDFIIHIKDKWTVDFGVEQDEAIVDDFLVDPALQKTNSKFKFSGISVTGWNNNKCQISSGFNSVVMDNYHFISQHAFPSDAVFGDDCSHTFEINDHDPKISGIFRSDGRLIVDKSSCLGFTLNSICTSGTSATPGDIRVTKNENWTGAANIIKDKISYKQWQAPSGYVSQVISKYGFLPTGVDEIAESGDSGYTADDYLWADWKLGVTVPDNIVGVSQTGLKKPTISTEIDNISWSTTKINDNLIQKTGFSKNTKNDFFIVSRGFINVTLPGYYVFSLQTGNTGVSDETQQIALFSLKHTKNYTLQEIDEMDSVDDITFTRDNTDKIETIGTTATGTFNLYSKVGEYGIIEIRQNEKKESSGHYYLTPGYYAFEIKASYSSAANKSLKLFWEAYEPEITEVLKFENIIHKKIIGKEHFVTLRNNNLSIEDTQGKGYLIVPNDLLEGGDVFNVVYTESSDSNNQVSGIMSSQKNIVKNVDITARFTSKGIPETENKNRLTPQKTVMVVFGATSRKKDLYASIDTYYALTLDGKYGKVSLSQITYSSELSGPISHRLNLNKSLNEKDNQIYSLQLLDENGYNFELEDGMYYDILLSIRDNKVSAYYKKNSKFSEAVNNVANNINQDVTKYVNDEPYTTIFTDISIDQQDADVQTTDWSGNVLSVADKYELFDGYGSYGFAIKSSQIKLEKYIVQSYDKVEDDVVDTTEKWKKIKPKFLDSRANVNLKFNSYGILNRDQAIEPSFSIEITGSYNSTVSSLPITESLQIVTDNSIKSVLASDVDASTWGTRFNVWFDKDWLGNRFANVEEVMRTVVIPFGNFQEPYINWLAVEDSADAYSETYSHAGYYPHLSESGSVLPHTIAVSGNSKIYISDLSRHTTDYSLIKLSGPLATILNGDGGSTYNGVWEEICPLSTQQTWITGKLENQVFEPIYKDITTKDQIIGVKFINSDVAYEMVCNYCEAQVLYGLYEITLPDYSVNSLSLDYNTQKVSNTLISPMRYFVPIGKLDKESLYLLPPVEMLRNNLATIQLKGVYAHRDMTTIGLVDKTTLKLNYQNKWEAKYKYKIKCNYFIDVSTSFFGKLTEYNRFPIADQISVPCNYIPEPAVEYKDECSSLPNAYYMPKNIISILNYLETNSTDFANEYDWWVPKNVWIKRQTTTVYPVNTGSAIFSGLNSPNNFYSSETISGEQGFKLTIDDIYDADITNYVIDAKWCVTNVGWDSQFATATGNSSDVSVFGVSAYGKMGFTETSKSKMGYERTIPVGSYMNATIPLQTVTVSGQRILQFGSYYDNVGGNAKTLSPYGLFNWFQGHSNSIDGSSESDRANWTNSEWNEQFTQCFKVENVLGLVPSYNFKINKYWSFYSDKIPPFSSIVSINVSNTNCASTTNADVVIPDSQLIIGTSDGKSAFYNIPPIYDYYPKWSRCINGVLVDNYTLPPDSYYVRVNVETNTSELILNTQSTVFDYSKIVGETTRIVVNFYSDKLLDIGSGVEEKLTDDFKNKREINWLTLIENDNIYKIAKRKPDSILKFTTLSEPFNIVEYKGEKVYQIADKFDYSSSDEYTNPNGFSGGSGASTEVGLNKNSGAINTIQLVDVPSNFYTVTADVIFDGNIVNEDYQKRFDLILKGENTYVNGNDWGLTDFYFVGIGAYNFDISLGMRSVDRLTGEVKETFLASFGEFNTRNVKVDTWYTLSAEVSRTSIKVFFHEKNNPPMLVLNYNIDKKYEKLSERYLKGEFETLEAVVEGLEELMITYPNKLGNSVSNKFTFENFKEEFAKTLPINGFYSGFRAFNKYTYVGNFVFKTSSPKQYKWGSTLDIRSLNKILEDIKRSWGMPVNPDIKKIKKTLNFTTYVLINDTLFYRKENGFIEKYPNPVYDFDTIENKIFVIEKLYPTDAALGLNSWGPGNHEFIWSLDTNVHDISSSKDFFNTVPNLTTVSVKRDSIEYVNVIVPGTSSTSATSISGSNILLKVNDLITLTTTERNVLWPLDGNVIRHDIMLRVYEEGFTREYTILIKDKTFYRDEIKSYMDYSQKKLRQVIINDSRLHLIFEDI